MSRKLPTLEELQDFHSYFFTEMCEEMSLHVSNMEILLEIPHFHTGMPKRNTVEISFMEISYEN